MYEFRKNPVTLSCEYQAVHTDAIGRILKVSALSVCRDSVRNRQWRGPAARCGLAELSWICLFIICFSVAIWAWGVSTLAFNPYSVKLGKNAMLSLSPCSVI